MSNEITIKRVQTCMNCKHCSWEVWLPAIKVNCKMKVPKAGTDKVCDLYETTAKSTWKDNWIWSVQYQGHPYEEI